MSTVLRGTSMQASSRSNNAPVNKLTFNMKVNELHLARPPHAIEGN
jgi:hypothetical protein